jgi:cobalt-zinc-cadmium efflux system protein
MANQVGHQPRTDNLGDSHHHSHSHAPKSFGFAFAVGLALNAGFVVIEAVFGILGNSTALLADAAHNLSDVLGLLVAWAAVGLSRRKPSEQFTYGLRGSSILAALFNAMFLLVAVGGIGWEAILRVQNPAPIVGPMVIAVALVGIAINGFTAWLFAAGRKDDLNIQGAFLHMAADAAVSAGVVVAAAVVMVTGWHWLDPAMSLAICVVILWSTWGLLKNSVRLSLAGVPPGIRTDEVRAFLSARPGVAEVHDLHIWSMSTSEVAMTCHLVMPSGHPGDRFLRDLSHDLDHQFGIGHPTVQIETSADGGCLLRPEHVV